MRDDKHKPVMFCHDSTSIFYPTGPGRVHTITFTALADCSGSDEDMSDSTTIGDCYSMACHGLFALTGEVAPGGWPIAEGMTDEQADEDFRDLIEQWADWCDRDSVRLDSLDEVRGRIERAA